MHRDECLPSGLADSPASGCWIGESTESSPPHVPAAKTPDRQECNICAPSVESRIKMELSWQLRQEFLDDYSRFNDWMRWAETVVKEPQSSQVLYTEAKEELKRFECLRKRTEDHVVRLESINRRYRRLAREQGLGVATQLKGMVRDGNQRWDNLQRRVGIICKRLKYFVSQREEFETERENLWLQLMELDIRRSELEYFSRGDAEGKLIPLQVFQQLISCISEKTDQLLMVAELLLQKCEAQDSVTIEGEVWDLLQFQQDVFRQVFDDWEMANREGGQSDRRSDTLLEERGVPDRPGLAAQRLLGEGVARGRQSGRLSPCSVDPLALEWDSSVDIGESRTHEGSVCLPQLDKSIGLDGKGNKWGCLRTRATHRRVKNNSRKLEQVDVACQCDSEVRLISGDSGPLFIKKQAVCDNLFQEVSSDERTIAEELRKTNGHWQHLDWDQTRFRRGQVPSDWLQGQTLDPRARARSIRQWLQTLEPKRKVCPTGAATLGVPAGVDQLRYKSLRTRINPSVLRLQNDPLMD
ncbi:nesprin-2 isoform X2 [Scyliorhinus torazame]|uniref:nesprin-2 isoform X2 n=1 Tax=Scyliorhinus torazame TaxID=75743 RepID=UPI003B59315A